MAKGKKSRRGRKKKEVIALTSKGASGSKSPSSAQKFIRKSSRNKSFPIKPVNSDSETSPLKGFKENEINKSPEVSVVVNKDDPFDKLLNGAVFANLHKNIKTYSNKSKVRKAENRLLEFEDCKNREDILRWLNDNRNAFDRLTQTQVEVVPSQSQCETDFDMPSVSQQVIPKLNRSSRKNVTKHRSPYKLRARSLDIQIKKNVKSGRSKRHSLAGDTPTLENYHIEEINTDEEAPISAEKDALVIIDLMEDEYLDNVEKEIMQHGGGKKNSLTGWDRIKDIDKSITKKQLKQLNISCIENKNEGNNNSLCVDYDVLENYFIENMEKMLNSKESEVSEASSAGKFSLKNAIQVGKNFVMILRHLLENGEEESLGELQPLIIELRRIFAFNFKEANTQTSSCEHLDQNVQTEEVVTADNFVQTELKTVSFGVQTGSNMINTAIQTDFDTCQKCANNKIIQFCDKDVQTEQETNSSDINLLRRETTGTTTPSDIFFTNEVDREEMSKAFEANFSSGETPNQPKLGQNPKIEDFDDDLDFNFATEELIQASKSKSQERVETQKSSVLVVSKESTEGGKGVKRLCSESPINYPEKYRSKRPCAKFINDDLSVAFSTCAEEDLEPKNVSEDSNGANNEECLNKKEGHAPATQATPKTRTQEQIEELENIIYKATKPSFSAGQKEVLPKPPPSPTTPQHEDDLDYFKLHSFADKTPKKSRRNLFDLKTENFSESMFASEKNATVVTNQTLTKDNVDVIMNEVKVLDEIDKEVQGIFRCEESKINILQNVVLKSAGIQKNCVKNDDCVSENSDDFLFSDVDVVESTPQKKMHSFSKESSRGEAMLDITLPPPLEFQDTEQDENTSAILDIVSPPRRPLAVINKITSTPLTQKPNSESFLSLSPITCPKKTPKSHSQSFQENQTNRRVLGPIELAQMSKFSPLTIVRKPQPSIYRPPSTPTRQKSILNYIRSSQESQESQKSDSFTRNKPCIACSRLSRDQVIALSAMTNKKMATYSTAFTSKVTHLVVTVNEKNCLKDHTIKYISAVAAGCWVVSFGWVQECLMRNRLVPEEPYEVCDVSGIAGPRQSRLTRVTKPLFRGYKIHMAPPFVSTTREEMENVVKMLGGRVVPKPDNLQDKEGYICVIVTEAKASQDLDMYEVWLEALGVITVDLEWLSRSVGQYQILSLRPFALCSEGSIDSLGYPPELVVSMAYSYSQQTFSSVPSSK